MIDSKDSGSLVFHRFFEQALLGIPLKHKISKEEIIKNCNF